MATGINRRSQTLQLVGALVGCSALLLGLRVVRSISWVHAICCDSQLRTLRAGARSSHGPSPCLRSSNIHPPLEQANRARCADRFCHKHCRRSPRHRTVPMRLERRLSQEACISCLSTLLVALKVEECRAPTGIAKQFSAGRRCAGAQPNGDRGRWLDKGGAN